MNRKPAMWLKTVAAVVFISSSCVAQKSIQPDLTSLLAAKKLTIHNREAKALTDPQKKGISLNAKQFLGLAWIPDAAFTTGTIEFDVKGNDQLQKSFVGVAFHGVNDSTHEAIYFRPFNFKSPERKTHSVQYISLPEYDWDILRSKYPDKNESAVNPPPDPNGWFHVRIVVTAADISVYVNNEAKASLVVKPIKTAKGKKLGFWVGNNSPGDFANLRIVAG